MDKLFLLDAYALIYRAYYAFIKNPRINSKGLNTSAVMGFVNTLNEVLTKEKPSHIGVAFDPKGPTFRQEMYPEYKAQREETPEDIRKSVPIIKEVLKAYRIPILEVAGYEADDVIGTLATKASKCDINTYMMTPDKDYGQIVKDNVFMYRPRHDGGFEIMGPNEVKNKYGLASTLQVIDLLALMGDTADNIPGCPGVGPKTAEKLIGEFGSVEGIIDNTDKLKGALQKKVDENKEQIKFSKILATIKTDVPIDLNLEALKYEEPNEAELEKIFSELEFHNFSKRILNKNEETKKNVQIQPDLFSEFTGEGQETSENSSFESLKTTVHEYKLIETEEDAKKLYDFLRTFQILSLDTETTSTDAIRAELVGLSFAVEENKAFYVAIPSEREKASQIVNIFKPLYENEEILKVGQNIKYDLEVLHNYDINLSGKMFDTMIAHYILNPELHHGMDYLAEIYLHYQTVHIEELIGPRGKNQGSMRDLPPEKVYEYAAEDADVTLKLKNILEKELKKTEGAENLFYNIEMPLLPVLAEMEMNGVRIDTQSLKETSGIFMSRMEQIESRIYELAGEKFNIASPKQVGDILFGKMKIIDKPKKTKTGQFVTSEEVLQELRGKNEIVKDILEHRGLKKLLGTYVDALPLLINEKTGRIHTSFNQTITATGRLSSSNPNLQNIPVRGEDGKEIRKAFIPEDGCEFFSADYSQIELRVMAHLSGDKNMIEAFREGDDIHAATAAKIYKEDIEDVTEDQRRKAKRANFGIIYGITTFGLAERLEIDRSEAKELIDGYFETYPQVKEYMDKSIEIARKQGYVETIFGRRRYLPDITSHNATVRKFAERNAINAPIQGSAADIIKVAMINIYKRFKTENIRSKMILQVHDELNFSVYPEEHEKVENIVLEEMDNAYKMQVPLTADAGWGKNWLEAH
jgi:DNA polymerase-1